MKIKLLMTAALCAAIGLTACTSRDAKLAEDLSGTWKGNTIMMNGKKDKPEKDDKRKSEKDDRHKDGDRDKGGRPDGGAITCSPTFTFVRTDGTNGGTINIAADYNVNRDVETMELTTPVRASVNGSVTASGTWTVKDGDEIIVSLDPAKTVVEVDTASTVLTYARLTDAPQESLNTIRDRVAANITDIVKPMLTGKIQKIHKFDDVKIIGKTMTLEAGHNRITFTKQ